jgi:hypothetical protein
MQELDRDAGTFDDGFADEDFWVDDDAVLASTGSGGPAGRQLAG